MSTKLEQIQAAAKAAQASGKKLFPTPVNAPVAAQPTAAMKSPAPVVGVAAAMPQQPVNPVSNPSKSASAINPAQQAEIQRKAAAGIALTNPTAATTAAYNAAKPPALQNTAFKSPVTAVGALGAAGVPAPKPSTTPAVQPNTNYVAKGGQTLNDILYLKDNYNPSSKNYVAAQSNPLYAKLDTKTASMVKGMTADELRNYINGLGKNATATTQNQGMANGAPDYNALATSDYQMQLDQLLAAAGAQEKELNRRYDYANGVTQDNRTLQDASFYRNNAPDARDGSTGYRGAMTDRNRSIEDHYTQEGLTDATAASYGTANAFRNNSNNFISTKANELQTQAQQLAMQEAGLTGTYKGQQTMQGAANAASVQGQRLSNEGQSIANQIAKIDLSTYPQASKLKLQQLQQQVNSGSISNAAAQYQLKELTNPDSVTNQVAALDLKMKQIDASSYSDEKKLQLEQLQKTIAQIGAVPPVSEYEQQMQYLDLQKAQLQVEQLQAEGSGKTASKTYEDYQSNIEKLAVRDSDTGELQNPGVVEEYIKNSSMSTYEKYRAWISSGLTWPDDVEVPTPGE